jgi:hypothetical protein
VVLKYRVRLWEGQVGNVMWTEIWAESLHNKYISLHIHNVEGHQEGAKLGTYFHRNFKKIKIEEKKEMYHVLTIQIKGIFNY